MKIRIKKPSFILRVRKPNLVWKIKKPSFIIRYRKPSMKIRMSSKSYNRMIMFFSFLRDNMFLLLSFIWMGIIFWFSNQPAYASSTMSSTVYSNLTQYSFFSILFGFIPIRKCGHLLLYLVLGILMFLHLRRRTNNPHFHSLAICYGYACFDEIHQLFIDGRGALPIDTFIDLAGAFFGIGLISIGFITFYSFKRKECKNYCYNLDEYDTY